MLRRVASSATGGVDASLLHAESTASTPIISGRSSARAAATHGMLTATTPLLYTLQRPPAGCSAATARSSVELCSAADQLFESPPWGVPSGRFGGDEEGAQLPPALHPYALCLSLPLLIEPRLGLAGTVSGAADARDRGGMSRMVPAAAAVAVAAAVALALDRQGLSSTVRRPHICTRTARSNGRLCELWLPLPPPRAASL